MEVPTPTGYRAQKMVVTYVYESPDNGKTVTQRLVSAERNEKVQIKPKQQPVLNIPVDEDNKIIVPISTRRKVGGQCEMCWKPSAVNHDLCHRCQAKIRYRFLSAYGLPTHS